MNEFKTDRAVFTPEDFVLWSEKGVLEVSPKFQRRGVWQLGAKSYLIDTILRGMTVPPLYIRVTQNNTRTKSIREVVDGQQRVRTVLDFLSDTSFKLSNTLKGPWAGKTFPELDTEQKQQIKSFGFSVEIFHGISDQQVLEVFCRLNMNGVPLNNQELRNGKYFGRFKQSSFDLALSHLEFWRRHKIFTEQGIARMLEVELTSELLIASTDGMQDKKKSIDDYYERYDSSYPQELSNKKKFQDTLGTIAESIGDDLTGTAFKRPPLFYTLYCVVYHHMFALPKAEPRSPKKTLSADKRQALKDAVLHLSDVIVASKDADKVTPKKYAKFIAACARQTDNILPRNVRFEQLYADAF